MLTVSFVGDDELQVEFELAVDPHTTRQDNAAMIMLAYSDSSRGKTVVQSYEDFANVLTVRWDHPVNYAMTYMVLETCGRIVGEVKKKHISEPSSKSLESTPPSEPIVK